MNDKLLLQKRIKFPKQSIGFLNFIHPGYEIVEDISEYANPLPVGIIYTGVYSDDIVSKLNSITKKWIIVNDHHYDLDLSTSEGLLKSLLPLQYTKLKNSKTDSLYVYTKMGYDSLLEKVKTSLVSNMPLTHDNVAEQHVFSLFSSILGTRDVLNAEYFTLVNKHNVSAVTSAILTFLNKVQTNKVCGEKIPYARLIIQSNKRYGKRIHSAICRFVKSKASKEIALYNLLNDLNSQSK
jgi:hypothetical protein